VSAALERGFTNHIMHEVALQHGIGLFLGGALKVLLQRWQMDLSMGSISGIYLEPGPNNDRGLTN
jgi:hypothetical protein